MRLTRFARRIILLAALPLLLLAIPAASAATASAAAGTGWIRLAHLSPNTPAVDVYLYSFGDSSAQIVLHHVAYGTVSPYEQVPAGDYTVAMRAAGAAATSAPVLSASVDVVAGRAYTVAGLGPESGLRLQVLDDQLTTPSGQGAGADHPGLAQAERGLGQLGRARAARQPEVRVGELVPDGVARAPRP